MASFTLSKGLSNILSTAFFHSMAWRWKSAPGNHGGKCFTSVDMSGDSSSLDNVNAQIGMVSTTREFVSVSPIDGEGRHTHVRPNVSYLCKRAERGLCVQNIGVAFRLNVEPVRDFEDERAGHPGRGRRVNIAHIICMGTNAYQREWARKFWGVSRSRLRSILTLRVDCGWKARTAF